MRSKPASVRRHEESIAKKEAKAIAEDKSVDRYIVFDPGWTGTIEQAAWLNCCTVSEWRERYAKKYPPTI